MLSSLAILTLSSLITLYELPPLWKKKLVKESLIFCFFLSFGTLISILLSFEVYIPNPLNWIIAVMKPITNIFDSLLN